MDMIYFACQDRLSSNNLKCFFMIVLDVTFFFCCNEIYSVIACVSLHFDVHDIIYLLHYTWSRNCTPKSYVEFFLLFLW